MKKKQKDRLRPKQERFVLEYLKDLNATQAAIRAGYSERTANEQGARLLVNVSVRRAVMKARSKIAAKQELTAERVLAMLEETRVDAEADGQYSAAVRAAELLGKHVGLWAEQRKEPAAADKTEMTTKEIDEQLAEMGYIKKENHDRDRNPASN